MPATTSGSSTATATPSPFSTSGACPKRKISTCDSKPFANSAQPRDCPLTLVGDGPRLAQHRGQDDVIVTGVLRGDELSAAYASGDIFGNVVLKAHASGLHAIVSDRGGPQEMLAAHGQNVGLA